MVELRFEWDPKKAAANLAKHGVSFEEAQTAFSDEGALLLEDSHAADAEDRFVLLGLSSRLRVLVVVHCYRETETMIRLISARKADRLERQQYVQRNS
jgi:uncharacterized DUF497 family protein